MAKNKKQEYRCRVVDEVVLIHLCKKSQGIKSRGEYFVQCDQGECQYVDENELPCPLDLSLFEEEIHDRDELAQKRREESAY